ncbi:MAG: DUF4127 family protein [Acidaminococcaceae bacterium]
MSVTAEANGKIVYVPLDNRPVCLDYVKQTIKAAGYELAVPPEKLLSDNEHNGNPGALWSWLNNAVQDADAAVLATDSLIYGGLVASRTHHDSNDDLIDKIKNFKELRENHPTLKIYGFSTVMRTPRQSFGNVEPPYYTKYGPDIFALTQLNDKEEGLGLTAAEKLKKNELLARLPQKQLADWLDRRQKNFHVNLLLTELARKRTFHYLAIGKDDDAPLSQTNMESRHLMEAALDLSSNNFKILPGVDQLGLLLLTRTINELSNEQPVVHVIYSEGAGKNTLPYYSDQRLSSSVPDQIQAAGGRVSEIQDNADLILAVNTPFDGVTKDSTADDNLFFSSIYNRRFINLISNFVKSGRTLAIADISYANGADNGFMEELYKHDLLEQIVAYSGWNTADNTIGYALSQGILAKKMLLSDKNTLLQIRYLDDWLYQSNIRPHLSHSLGKNNHNIIYDFTPFHDEIVASAYNLYAHYLKKDHFLQTTDFKIDFPWNRLFEINVTIKAND